ncbi:MAG TPA: hypothetical protein O0X70_04405 [Methanocorpusculum sp.]|nr:hypothetical protein [Methanocorpusculum sp.]
MSDAEFDTEKKGLSIASLVLGIFGLIMDCVIPIVGIIACIVAIILGAVAIHKKQGVKGLSIAGIVLGIVGLVFAVLFVTIIAAALVAYGLSLPTV